MSVCHSDSGIGSWFDSMLKELRFGSTLTSSGPAGKICRDLRFGSVLISQLTVCPLIPSVVHYHLSFSPVFGVFDGAHFSKCIEFCMYVW